MCEIQIVISKNELKQREKQTFFNMMVNGGFGNADAWGVYYNGKIYKEEGSPSESAILFSRMKRIVEKGHSSFIFGHNRLSTGALAKDNANNHPFETDNYVVVHNGIISNHKELKRLYDLDYKEEVDSYVIPALLEHNRELFPEEHLVVKSVAEEISGSYSVFIYSKASDCFYYFKNKSTHMTILSCDNTLFLSTDRDSIELWKENTVFNPKHRTGELESSTIYKIARDTTITALCDFTIKVEQYIAGSYAAYQKAKAKDPFDLEVEYLLESVGADVKVLSWHVHNKTLSVFVDKNVDRAYFEVMISEHTVWEVVNAQEHRKTLRFDLRVDEKYVWAIKSSDEVIEEEEDDYLYQMQIENHTSVNDLFRPSTYRGK